MSPKRLPEDAYERMPAVLVLLGVRTPGHGLEVDGTPWECPGCPFAGDSVEPYEDIRHDESEAHYDCRLLGRRVWGESAPCTREDWQKRAREELDIEEATA